MDADPFNCPKCGSHDYGLYMVPFGECVWCMKQERDTLKQECESMLAEKTQIGEYVSDLIARHGEELSKLQKKVDARQAKIDALMLEYCPGEMSEGQKARWGRHQVPSNGSEGV